MLRKRVEFMLKRYEEAKEARTAAYKAAYEGESDGDDYELLKAYDHAAEVEFARYIDLIDFVKDNSNMNSIEVKSAISSNTLLSKF